MVPSPVSRSSREGRHPAPRGSRSDRDYLRHNKVDLYERARRLRIEGRSRMSKRELARAIARVQ
jgi:hypothetical protein